MKPWVRSAFLAAALVGAGSQGATAGTLDAELDGVRVELTSEPEGPGTKRETSYVLRLAESTGRPVTGAQITLRGRMADGMKTVKGIKDVSVDRKAGEVFVDYDGQAARTSDLVAAAQAAGFKARPASP